MLQIVKKYRYDLIAAVVFVFLLCFNFYSVKFGLRIMDEHLYTAIAQRFADGMKPLVDEWHVTQLSNLFLVIPFSVFKKITGGTEGVSLFMRQLFVVVNSLLFLVFYNRLRHFKAWGLIAASVVSSFVPHAMFALNYYTMTIHLLMLFTVFVLINNKEPSSQADIPAVKLIFGGVFLSLAVIIQPPLACLYFIYSIAVVVYALIQKRKPEFGQSFAFFLKFRCWKYISVSVCICAAVFILFLHLKSGLANILNNIPNILNDPYYDISAFQTFLNSLVKRVVLIVQIFGPFNCILFVAVFPTVIILHRTKLTKKFKYPLFLISNILIALWFAVPLVPYLFSDAVLIQEYFCMSPLPFLAFGIINYSICEEKNPRLLFIWLVAALSSIFLDAFSTYTLGTYGIIAFVPGIICFGKIVEEYKSLKNKTKRRKAKKSGRINRFLINASGLAFTVFILLFCYNTYLQAGRLLYEGINVFSKNQSSLTQVQTGPLKGIYTTKNIKNNIYDYQEDLDLLKENSKTLIYINNPNPMAFSYLDIPTANRFVWPSVTSQSRHMAFFSEHPETRPDVIYLCDTFDLTGFDSWQGKDIFMEFAKKICSEVCEGQIVEGKRGTMIFVNHWKENSFQPLIEWSKTIENKAIIEEGYER